MTVLQRQALLFYLGYYPGPVDGDWGKASRAGCVKFQSDYGLTADGIGGPVTDKALIGAVAGTVVPVRKTQNGQAAEGPEWWKDIRYFKRSEFRCPCGRCGGFPVEPEEKLVRTVDEIRHRLGKPIGIVDSGGSGVRCQAHNDELPGSAKNSYHVKGMAADLHCSTASPAEMKAVAEAVMGSTGGIGLYSWGIHVDVGKFSRWTG